MIDTEPRALQEISASPQIGEGPIADPPPDGNDYTNQCVGVYRGIGQTSFVFEHPRPSKESSSVTIGFAGASLHSHTEYTSLKIPTS